MCIKKYLKREERKIPLPDACVKTIAKRKRIKTQRFTTVACAFMAVLLITVVAAKLNAPSIKNKKYSSDEDHNSYFYNKYDMFSYVAMKATSTLGNGMAFIFPEGDIFEDANINPAGTGLLFHYRNYTIRVNKIQKDGDSLVIHKYDFESQYEYYKRNNKRVERVEVNDMQYLVVKDCEIFFVKEGYGITIYTEIDEFPGIYKILEDIQLIKYEFVSNGIARGKVYDETKTMDYSFNGASLKLSYQYKEINYVLGTEYDVYADGVNEYMFDADNKLIGYNLKEPVQNGNTGKDSLKIAAEEISKYADKSLFTLENQKDGEEGSYYEYRQSINGFKTNGTARIRVDKNGNVTEFFINESKVVGEIPAVNKDLIEKEIKEALEVNIEYAFKVNAYKIEEQYYTVNQYGDLAIVCHVNANLQRAATSFEAEEDVKIEPSDESLIITIKVKDVVG